MDKLHRCAVFGATGALGRILVDNLHSRGHLVTAIARTREALKEFDQDIAARCGDARDQQFVDRVLIDQDVVVSLLGNFNRKPNTEISDATRAIVNSLRSKSDVRLICVTTLGLGDSSKAPNWFMRMMIKGVLKNVWADRERQEDIIEASSLNYSIIRPAGLTNKKHTDANVVFNSGAELRNIKMVPRAAVSNLIVDLVEENVPFERKIAITG